MDLVIASMVFHLVPPNALPKLFAGLADVLDEQGILVWNAPDIGPAPPDAVLLHEPNRILRRRFLEILQDPSELSTILASLSIAERRSYGDLTARLAEIGARLIITPEVRAARQAAADRQILPIANDLGEIDRELARSFVGKIFSKHFEMRPSDSLEAILVPSNQHYLPEVDDLDLRRRITSLAACIRARAAMPAEIASVVERVTVRTVTEAAAGHEVWGEAPILSEVDRSTANSVRARSACPKRFSPRDAPAALRGNDEPLDRTTNVGTAV
jgi:hypothetical protein